MDAGGRATQGAVAEVACSAAEGMGDGHPEWFSGLPQARPCRLVQKLACALAPCVAGKLGYPSMDNPFGGNRSDRQIDLGSPPNPCF
jgi:hypothetical protein